MRITHVLTFYDSLRNVLFLNHFECVLTHTRHYTEHDDSWEIISLKYHSEAWISFALKTLSFDISLSWNSLDSLVPL